MIDIEQLKKQYPLVDFKRVDRVFIPRSEEASYRFGQPKGYWAEGDFVRMENPMGGADSVRASDVDEIRRLAAWHQARAEAAGSGRT